jgi:hypothetical protein
MAYMAKKPSNCKTLAIYGGVLLETLNMGFYNPTGKPYSLFNNIRVY